MWYNGAGGDFLTHLLVVDDEVSILELIKNSLGKDGYLITVCQNADDVDIKKLHFYDLILLDVMMPGTDGFEFCKQIRNMVDCPILFLTAKTLEEDILFGLGICYGEAVCTCCPGKRILRFKVLYWFSIYSVMATGIFSIS